MKRNNKFLNFFKPTKRKIKMLVIISIFLFLIETIFFSGMLACFRLPCEDGTYGYYRTYYDCGRCEEPTIKEDIEGYSKLYLFHPLRIFSDFKHVDRIGFRIGTSALIFDLILLYSLVCFYEEKFRKEVVLKI